MANVKQVEAMQKIYEEGIEDGMELLAHAIKKKMKPNTKGKRFILLYESDMQKIIDRAKDGEK